MTKFKKRFIKIGIIALMPILALLFCLQNTYAYYLDSDGNLHSNNLWSLNSDYYIDTDQYIVYNDELLLDSGTYTFSFIFNGTSANCDFRLYTTYEDQAEFSRVFDIVNGQNTLTFTLNSNTTKVLWYSNAVGSYSNLMINVGNTRLDYEPYGIWWNEDAYEHQKFLASIGSVYEIFNGATCRLESGNGDGFIMYDFINISPTATSLSFGDLPTSIKNYINNHSSEEFDIWIILKKQVGMSFYVNANTNLVGCSVHYDYYNDNYPLNSNYYMAYNQGFNTNSYLVNPSFNYNFISFYYIKSGMDFNITLSYDNYYYKQGYTDGYNKGQQSGYDNGYNVGNSDGYNEGYNIGIQQDVETSGMKTLFNSILSYPVNMIKSVFNFEFMGINIASVIMFIVSIGIVIFVIKKFKE